MSFLLITLLLALNLAISSWNAYAAGALWQEAKSQGGWFKFLIICVVIMSAGGFFQFNVIVFGALFYGTGLLDESTLKLALEVSYLFLAPTIIGTGLIIWLDSLAQAWRQRDILSTGAAAWNTYAMYHNVSDAMSVMPEVAGDVAKGVGGLFEGEEGPKVFLLFVLLVFFVLSAVMTYFMVRHFWRKGVAARQHLVRDYLNEHRPAHA